MFLKTAYATIVTCFALTLPAQAATLGVLIHDYGTGPGQVDPGGNDTLLSDAVVVSDQSSARFFDAFDLSAFAADTIDSFELTLTFEDAGPDFFAIFPLEAWSVRVQGSDAGSVFDDMFRPLFDPQSPQTITLSASTLLAGDAFAHSVASGSFEFWFSEFSLQSDAFRLDQAQLTVIGEPAAVPLPASLPLLIAGLGGVAALRRGRGKA